MHLELELVLNHGIAETADVLNRGFFDYFVPVQLDEVALLHSIRQDSLDLTSSRVILCDGEAVGAALIARRGWTSRLAGMAIAPEARGQGIGLWCMDRLLYGARARGERAMVLEVIEQNDPAVRLYQRCGFRTLRRLVSYVVSQPRGVAEAALDEVDLYTVARLVSAHGLPDLPWQISGESLAQVGPPNRAYRLGTAYVAISNPDETQVVVRSLVVEPEGRRQGQATRLLQAVMARHPGKRWRVPALCPEEVGGVFEKAGFVKEPLSQFQMVADLEKE
jgi:ribosomal protein S18 acetylase RimI-like enzyme